MAFIKRYLFPLFFSKRFYQVFCGLIVLFILAYASPVLFFIARILVGLFVLLITIDYLALFGRQDGIAASRSMPERFSNGDDNEVTVSVQNNYSFAAHISVIDELPVQFQKRDFSLKERLASGMEKKFLYRLRPVERGEYLFNDINLFIASNLRLVVRRYTIAAKTMIKVYPSYLQLKKYDLIAYSNNLSESGNRRIRKIGQSMEFEQIREYVNGDDIRSINWKATGRKGGQMMVNNYTDERSQQIYCVIDKGRVMKMPFEGMSLLDYAINATLMLSRVALLKQDKAGLVTFSDTIGQVLPADRRAGQMNAILETLYDQRTQFGETDYEKLHALFRTRISQRSLIVLFTNFESMSGLSRQLPFIRSIAGTHLVLVVFFENTELRHLTEKPVNDLETLYIRTIAEKFVHEKQLMGRELQQHGIFTILTAPENLTINTVNKYLELKARQAI